MKNLNLGKVTTTPKIRRTINSDDDFREELCNCFEKFINCDWGKLNGNSIFNNEEAMLNGKEVIGEYNTSYGSVLIKTRSDRSFTIIKFDGEAEKI